MKFFFMMFLAINLVPVAARATEIDFGGAEASGVSQNHQNDCCKTGNCGPTLPPCKPFGWSKVGNDYDKGDGLGNPPKAGSAGMGL